MYDQSEAKGFVTKLGGEKFLVVEMQKRDKKNKLYTDSIMMFHVDDDMNILRKVADFTPVPEESRAFGILHGKIYDHATDSRSRIGTYVTRFVGKETKWW